MVETQMGKVAFLFPGQGSQKVGMGQTLFEQEPKAKRFLDKADAALGFSLSTMMLNGPDEVLKQTEHAQPALVTMSAAVLELFRESGITADYVAGHSLGEYSALVASDSLTFEEAVTLVHKRGKLMQAAVPSGEGAMAAVLGLDQETLTKVCQQVSAGIEVAELANLNCPGQIVISGTVKGIEEASELAKSAGARRVMPLAVSGPFHSSLMKPAAEQFEGDLHLTQFTMPMIPLVANVTADVVHAPEVIRALLAEQIYSPVRFEESILHMVSLGVDTFIEIGSGNVLTGLVRKIDRKLQVFSVHDRNSFEQTLVALKGE